jgi:thiol-disulfide isomerase/thioredoxin
VLPLLITLAVVAVVGVSWRARQGRLHPGRSGTAIPADVLADLGVSLGERGALVQFSSAFCQPCRAARQVLAGVARSESGVTHIDVDAESHLKAVRTLGISSTPTTLIVDAAGRERFRATGVPRPEQVRAALGLTDAQTGEVTR